MLRLYTAGESHGPALIGYLEGLPAGVPVDLAEVNRHLRRRQGGFGRGGRQKIEKDRLELLGGVRFGRTLGSPLGLLIRNKDWENWRRVLQPEQEEDVPEDRGQPEREPNFAQAVTRPRPGHSDLPGGLKYGHRDLRNVLERASARETAMRVAAGAVCRQFLAEFDIDIVSHVVALGPVSAGRATGSGVVLDDLRRRAEASPVRCADEAASDAMVEAIKAAMREGDTLGGIFEVIVKGVPVGLGSHVQWDRKLDGRLAQAFMSIQAMKGVEIGLGFEASRRPGSEVHDEIFYDETKGYYRKTNRAGGTEGGMSNGEPLVIRTAMKPLPTLMKPLRSVDMETKEPFEAVKERSDVTAVPAAAVIGEAVAAFVVAQAMLESFGADHLQRMKKQLADYRQELEER